MAARYSFRCPGCGFEIGAWNEGHPYILDDKRKRHFTYHPCERDVMDAVIAKSAWASGKTPDEIEALLPKHTGCLVDAICLDCGATSRSEWDSNHLRCRRCKGTQVRHVLDIGGKICPKCKKRKFPKKPEFGAIS